MGRKSNIKASKASVPKKISKTTSPKKTKVTEEEEFQLDLKALEGYDLPNSENEDEEDTSGREAVQPEKKKVKKSKSQVLGLDYKELEEKRLEQLLFGDLIQKFNAESLSTTAVPEKVKKSKKKNNKVEEASDEEASDDELVPEDVYGKTLGLSSAKRKAAWVDEDDEEVKLKDVVASYKRAPGKHGSKETSETNYKEYLEKNFASVHGQATPKWAELGENAKKIKDDDEDSDDLTKTATDLLVKDSVSLPQNIIQATRLKDINKESRAEGFVIKSVDFHKLQNVALVAGKSEIVSLFQVDGKTNAKVQSIKFKEFPIFLARFSADGSEVLASSRLSANFQAYDLVHGRNRIIPHTKDMNKDSCQKFVLSPDGKWIAFLGSHGYIHLMSARSKEWITSFKMNGGCYSATFNADGTRLYTHGDLGEVYVWDMNSRRCVHKFIDDGCIKGTAIAISPTQQYLACGSSSGVVNLYNTSKLESSSFPKPEKVILNLVTHITGIHFHPSSELMSMYSEEKENAVRLVHFPSITVFQNFPRSKASPVVNSMNFSPNGGYMAMGLGNGFAELYRLHQYDQY